MWYANPDTPVGMQACALIHTLIHIPIQAMPLSFTNTGCDKFTHPLLVSSPTFGCPKTCHYNHTRQLEKMPCNDTHHTDENFQKRAKQYIQFGDERPGYEVLKTLGEGLRKNGCKFLEGFLRDFGLPLDTLCMEAGSAYISGMVDLCPATCRCTSLQPLCPKSCPARL